VTRSLWILLLITGCAPESEQVPIPSNWRKIDAGQWSFAFPQEADLSGLDDMCGGRSAPRKGCANFVDSVFYSYRSGSFELKTRDIYGDAGPPVAGLELIRINDVPVHRARLLDGRQRLVVTDAAAPFNSDVAFDRRTETPLLWITCGTPVECNIARAIVGSFQFELD
jgi:hypothetical protein